MQFGRAAAFAMIFCSQTALPPIFANRAAAAGLPPPGAASCTGCHATSAGVKSPGPRLEGAARDQMLAALAEFRRGERPATVMDRLVHGFSEQELQAIVGWFAEQK